MSNALVRVLLPAVVGALIGGGLVEFRHRAASAQAPAASTTSSSGSSATADLDTLRADVARLKANAPSQSHTMSDVAYHWTNLWFAGEKKNWPLAQFYFEETRQHILWTIRLRPVRKGPDGKDVNLVPIFEAIDSSAFKSMAEAIEQKDSKTFESAYRTALEACYGCHKSSGKEYLRPEIPTAPAQTIIKY